MAKKRTTCCLTKFLLLLHKNWLLLWYRKCGLLVELFLPAIICLLLVPIRLSTIPKEMNSRTYTKKFPINSMEFRQFQIEEIPAYYFAYGQLVYGHENPCYHQIAKPVADKFGLGYHSWDYARQRIAMRDFRFRFIAIHFDNSTDCHKNLNFELRFWSIIKRQNLRETNITWMTNQLFVDDDPIGPRNPDIQDGGIPGGYLRDCFLTMQHAIVQSFFKLSAKNFKGQALPKVEFQRFPYQKYKHDEVILELAHMLPWIIMLGYMHTMLFIVWQVTTERKKQLKEPMIMSGLPNWLHWTAWFVRAFVILGLSALLVTKVLTAKWDENEYAILNYSSFTEVYWFLLAYITTSITFCFMIATMFSEAITAMLVAVVLWFITFLPFVPLSILARNYVNMTLFAKLMWLLLPNTALNFGIHVIMGYEVQAVGLQRSNMFDPVNADDSLSMGLILIAMFIYSCIYMLISLYLEHYYYYVGHFGFAKNWNFPFEKAFWSKKLPLPAPHEPRVTNSGRIEPDSFESETVGRPIGIQIINLKKSYGKRQIVKELSMNMYEDEITVLLGHNDDGKRTTISMMTGMIPPTSGTVIINGYDIKTNLNGARMSLGICPRYNNLFDDLTVKQHLTFYSRLRGLSSKALDREVKKYLQKIGLEKQANVASSKLSGGMKRMLCLCTALCGGTKVVLCDESSSGLDPTERKMLWKLLKSERKGRTILFATNFVDEADVLGDRIAIMCDGELKCMGTSLFLIKKFGYGFKLTINRRPKCRTTAEVTTFLNQYIPGIKPKADVTELSYHLSSKYASIFPTMLQELENESNTLAINGFDIAMTSLEDVFMKVGAENSSNDAFSRMICCDGAESPTSSSIFLDNKRVLWGLNLIISQWQAMLWKKILSSWRNKVLFAFQNLFTICLIVLTLTTNLDTNFPSLKMDLTRYRETVTVLGTSKGADRPGSIEHEISSNFKSIIRSESSSHQLEDIGNQDFINYMLELGKTQQTKIDTKYIAAATIDKGSITAWLNNEPLHSAPLTLNLIHNAMAKTLIGPEASISVSNHPRRPYTAVLLYLRKYYHNDAMNFNVNYGFCMSIVTALYALNVIKEKQNRTKLFQFMSGVDVLTYWLSHFIWDYITFALTVLVTIITLYFFQMEGYTTLIELRQTFGLILLFGCSALPMTYIVARFFTEPAAGMSFLAICNIINGPFIFYIFQFIKKTLKYVKPDDRRKEFEEMINDTELSYIYYPHFALIQTLKKSYYIGQCWKYCKDLRPFFDSTGKRTETTCLEEFKECCCPKKEVWSSEYTGIIPEVTALLITAGVFFLILILTEYIPIPRLWNIIRGIFTKLPKPQANRHCNEDVEQEKLRVANLSKKERQNQNIVIKKLTKFYGSHVAVNQISVGIKHHECFGLLGMNGAGKTTILKMLSGEERISSGDAFVKGMNVKWRMNAIHQQIGYCPQQCVGLFDNLTGRENLYIYALLRGIPRKKISSISLQLVAYLGFIRYNYEPVREYSWENKRNLSIALALLGGPSVIYLDEPTTRMDPASRRNIWNIICKLRDTGSSIVLASHSIEECEALCNRVALMVNGEFRYIASTQYIKSRLAKGLMLKIKMRRKFDVTATDSETELGINIDSDSDNGSDKDLMAASTQKVVSFIKSKFPCAVLQESNREFLIFYIPLEKRWWSKLFHIDANKDTLNIEDYCISPLTYGVIF